MPVVSMIAGSVLASEAITIPGAVGGLIVLLGVYLGALSNPKRVSTTPSPAASN
jgi:drug/metabolite transporter (DMT)-like permease